MDRHCKHRQKPQNSQMIFLSVCWDWTCRKSVSLLTIPQCLSHVQRTESCPQRGGWWTRNKQSGGCRHHWIGVCVNIYVIFIFPRCSRPRERGKCWLFKKENARICEYFGTKVNVCAALKMITRRGSAFFRSALRVSSKMRRRMSFVSSIGLLLLLNWVPTRDWFFFWQRSLQALKCDKSVDESWSVFHTLWQEKQKRKTIR